ncbi:MAG: hypothetical protein ACRYFU_10955 [Janthinobacterium lividum]
MLSLTALATVTGCGTSGNATTSTSSGTTASTTTLAASSTAVEEAVKITLTATVSPAAATGTITFYDGTTALGRARGACLLICVE